MPRTSTAEKRAVVLFQEVDPNSEIDKQQKVGVMSHWEAKRYVEEQPEDLIYFTISKSEYEKLTAKPARKRRKRRTKAEMQAARNNGKHKGS